MHSAAGVPEQSRDAQSGEAPWSPAPPCPCHCELQFAHPNISSSVHLSRQQLCSPWDLLTPWKMLPQHLVASPGCCVPWSCRWDTHRIIEWLGWKGPLRSSISNPPAIGRDNSL